MLCIHFTTPPFAKDDRDKKYLLYRLLWWGDKGKDYVFFRRF